VKDYAEFPAEKQVGERDMKANENGEEPGGAATPLAKKMNCLNVGETDGKVGKIENDDRKVPLCKSARREGTYTKGSREGAQNGDYLKHEQGKGRHDGKKAPARGDVI
jgi:hypothetical protein